jgi:glycosyltransferase involved in cell wall biosynthesis
MRSNVISVVIPTYQHADAVKVCLESLRAQEDVQLEIIVVNDGSTDNTTEILTPYEEEILVIHQENSGSNPARNRGAEESTGAYIIFVDADVSFKPGALRKMQDLLDRHAEASYVYSGFRFGWKIFRCIAFDAEKLRVSNYIHTTSLMRREDFAGFDNKIKRLQDWDLWLTMLAQGKKGIGINEILFSVMIDGDSRIGSSWLPAFMYRLPWKRISWKPKTIQKYEEAKRIILEKHAL